MYCSVNIQDVVCNIWKNDMHIQDIVCYVGVNAICVYYYNIKSEIVANWY